jgi:hypothetical protein
MIRAKDAAYIYSQQGVLHTLVRSNRTQIIKPKPARANFLYTYTVTQW